VTETFGATTRTAATTYDAAGRAAGRSLVVSPAADGGTAVPDVTTGYDPATGLPTTTTIPLGAITVGYDSLGRSTSYTQTDGGATVTAATRAYDIAGRLTSLNDGKGVTTYSYDSSADHRGLLTGVTDSQAGTFGGQYNADGTLEAQTYPGGLAAETAFDSAGNPVQLRYLKAGTPWLTFSQSESIHGQVVGMAGPASQQTYDYDRAGRLRYVEDLAGSVCTRGGYSYDINTNRLAAVTVVEEPDTTGDSLCVSRRPFAAGGSSFDAADRVTDPGYAYDHLGRTTAVPANRVTGDASVSAAYFANDLVASLSQAGHARGYALDPTQDRVAAITDTAGPTLTNHYIDTGDSPAWTDSSDGTWNRYVDGPAGGLAAITKGDGNVELQLTNLHGDVVATCTPADSAPAAYFESTEYGLPRASNTTNPRYGWLGAHQRDATNTLGGLTLMGVRLYNPTTGRFLQTDPVPGGSCNDYDYTCGDPINKTDLDGKWWTLAVRAIVGTCKIGRWCVRSGKFAWRGGKWLGRRAWRGARWAGGHAWRGVKWGGHTAGKYLFGRKRTDGFQGVLNRWGVIRAGYSWNKAAGRNVFSIHGGYPYPKTRWQRFWPRFHKDFW
jgi:RHS repeat-associated protein